MTGKTTNGFGWQPTILLIGAITVLRIAVLSISALNLGEDETQYWAWAQDLDFGYFSKPPLIAWIIAATTSVFGDGPLAVRLAAPLLHGGTALTIYAIGCTLFDRPTAFWSAVVYATLPAVSLSAGLISTDVPLLLFWALALLALIRALKTPTWPLALGCGAAIGLGLLAKYAMIYFVPCAVIGAFLVPRLRNLLLSRWSALAGGFAALVFAPNVIWNAAKGFPTFAHTAANANLGGRLFNPFELAEFLGAQFGVFGPILFAALIVGTVLRVTKHKTAITDQNRLLLSFSLPVLAVACGVAFLSRANANWAAPAYVAATPLVVHWLMQQEYRFWLKGSVGLHAVIAIVIAAGMASPAFADAAGLANGLKRVRGWEPLGRTIARRVATEPYTAILAEDRETMGALIYYARPRAVPVVMWNWSKPPRNHYEMAMTFEPTTEARVLLVSPVEKPEYILDHFRSVVSLGRVTIRLDAKRRRIHYLFTLEGYEPS